MVNIFSSLRNYNRPILGEQPSIFEVHYPSSLSSSLYQASKFTAKILAVFKGSKYKYLNANFEGIYLAFISLLNLYYLKQYGASFFEHFYGIKRIVSKTGTVPRSNVEIIRSLLQIVLLPYIKDKITEWKNKLSQQSNEIQSKWKYFLIQAWPYILKFISISSIILQILYLFGWAPIHNIEMLIAGIYYEKYSTMDLKLMENNKLLFDSSTIAGRSMNLILGLFSKFGKLLSFIMIGIQVLQYVQQSQDNGSSNIMSMFGNYVPGERKSEIQFPVEKLSERDTLSLSKDQCPLCLKKRENDTVLSVSGYIFCFKCIHNYVKKYGLCPVTSTPATLNELVRLYME